MAQPMGPSAQKLMEQARELMKQAVQRVLPYENPDDPSWVDEGLVHMRAAVKEISYALKCGPK